MPPMNLANPVNSMWIITTLQVQVDRWTYSLSILAWSLLPTLRSLPLLGDYSFASYLEEPTSAWSLFLEPSCLEPIANLQEPTSLWLGAYSSSLLAWCQLQTLRSLPLLGAYSLSLLLGAYCLL